MSETVTPAAVWRDGVLRSLVAFDPSQPRDAEGQWTSDGSDQSGASADEEAKRLYAQLLNLPPEQRAAFLAGLSDDQLTRLGAFASLGKATDGPIADIRNKTGQAMAGRGLDPGRAGLKSKGGKKKAAKKGGSKGRSSGGGSKGGGGSSGGKKSSGGGGGGGSKSSGGGSSSKKKSASSSKAPAKKEPEKPKAKPKPPPRTSPTVSPTRPGRPPRGPSRPPSTQPVLSSAGPSRPPSTQPVLSSAGPALSPAALFRSLVAEQRP